MRPTLWLGRPEALTQDASLPFRHCFPAQPGSYPGASATKLQNDYEEAKKALQAAETNLAESTAAFEAMNKARGGGDEEEAVRSLSANNTFPASD